MTVRQVWGRIQGHDTAPTSQQGDVWTFDVPPWATNPIVAEFWAEDEAGNQSYRTAILEIEDGTIKCIRWQKKDTECIMIRTVRPSAVMLNEKPVCDMIKHICPKMEA